jgi:hypothetical protein
VKSEAVMKPKLVYSLKGEKTNAPEPAVESEPVLKEIRTISNPIATATSSGTKRQRVVTPAATKAIDIEDEPRTSPSIRKMSLGNAKHEGEEGDRKILGAIENV